MRRTNHYNFSDSRYLRRIFIPFILFILLFFFSGCSRSSISETSSSRELSQEDLEILDEIHNKFLSLRESLEEEANELGRNEIIINEFLEGNFETFANNSSFNNITYYDIQGFNVLNREESIRDTTIYHRLMGHMDFSSQLIAIGTTPYLSTIVKVYTPEVSFIGIIKLDYDLTSFSKEIDDQYKSSTILIMDSSHFIMDLKTNEIFTFDENSSLMTLLKEASAFESKVSSFEIDLDNIKGFYFYKVSDGLIVLLRA